MEWRGQTYQFRYVIATTLDTAEHIDPKDIESEKNSVDGFLKLGQNLKFKPFWDSFSMRWCSLSFYCTGAGRMQWLVILFCVWLFKFTSTRI